MMMAPRLAALLALLTACVTQPKLHVAVTGPAAPALPAGRPIAIDERDPLPPDLVERALLVAEAYHRYDDALSAMEEEARGRGCDTLARLQSSWGHGRTMIAAVCASRTASTTFTSTTSGLAVQLETTPAGARVYAWSSSPAVSRGDLVNDWRAAAPTRALCVAPCTTHLVPGSYILGYAPDDGAPRFGEHLELAGPAAVDLRMKDNSSWRLAGVLVMVGGPLLVAGGVVVGTQTEDYGIRTGVVVGGSLLLVASGLVGLSLLKTSDEVVVTARDAAPGVR